jgi:hypothetical protein
MNKIQAILVLLLVLAFGGAMAQAGDAKQAVPPPALVLPQGVELSDEDLAGVEGKAAQFSVGWAVGAGAVAGGIAGYNSCLNCDGWQTAGSVAAGAALGGFSAGKGLAYYYAAKAAIGFGKATYAAQSIMFGLAVSTAAVVESAIDGIARWIGGWW